VLEKINRLAERQLRVPMLQGDGGPGKALDQGVLDGAQPIGATEIIFDIGDKAIEFLGRARAAVELAARKQLRLGCLCERRRAAFARLSGWQPVGNWVASVGEFSSIPVTRRRHPDNEQKNRDAQFASKNGTSSVTGKAETIPRGGVFFFEAAIAARLDRLTPSRLAALGP
jgi:hypothetical protein